MICGLIGEVYTLEAMRVGLNVNGVIYSVALSLQTSSKLTLNKPANLLITQIIREDANLLFGFLDRFEQMTFERLLRVNGVGPKVALAILSAFSPEDFSNIITDKDIEKLKKVTGVGAKSAGRILLDFAGFFANIADFSQSQNNKTPLTQPQTNAKSEASLALESLGYKPSDIKKVIQNINTEKTEEIIKEALKLLH